MGEAWAVGKGLPGSSLYWRSLHTHPSKKKQGVCKVRSLGSKWGRPPDTPHKTCHKYQCLGFCGPKEALEVGTMKLELSDPLSVILMVHRKNGERVREMALIRAH